MNWTNYHNHSQYDDGKDSIEHHVISAISQNVKSLGFSGHCPVPFENKWCMKRSDLDDYFNDIKMAKEKYADQIQIYKSLEIDYIPGIISTSDQWIKELKLDYTIGSIHFVGKYENGAPGEVDGTRSKFLEALNNIHQGDVVELVRQYFQLTRQMVKEATPDIVGHLDKIKMQNHGLWDENESWYKEEVMATLEEIRFANSIVEVNTRGIYKKLTKETYPGPWILKQIHQMNIPVQINSDAHVPREITNNFSETLNLLYQIGFRKLKVFNNNEWEFGKLDIHGMKW